jgi:hypothetical protein
MPGQIREQLLDRLRCSSETASIDDFAALVESAVMAPDVSKIDIDRHPDLGLPVWNFRDEVMSCLFMGTSLLLEEDLLIPFVGTNPEQERINSRLTFHS